MNERLHVELAQLTPRASAATQPSRYPQGAPPGKQENNRLHTPTTNQPRHFAMRYTVDIEIDYQTSIIACDGKQFPFPALSTVAQELVVAGGAENVVKKRLASVTMPA